MAAHAPKLAFLVALTAMLGSLYFSEERHFIPCQLCWYQRILMYPLVAVLLVGIITSDRRVSFYVLPLSLIGFGFSTYHYLIQNAFVEHSGFCQAGVSCSVRWVNYWGFATIPFMAQVAFALISLLLMAALWANHRVEYHDEDYGED